VRAGHWMVYFGSYAYSPGGVACLVVLPRGTGLCLLVPVIMAKRARKPLYF
jgi:hypothetical protein